MVSAILKIFGTLIKVVLSDKNVCKISTRNQIRMILQIAALIEKNELYCTEL